MKKLPYREGDLFAVPLRDHGYAVGLVARSGPHGRVLFGYFFATRYDTVPDLSTLQMLEPTDAVLQCRFGDLSLINGEWTILGPVANWSRTIWSMPPFVRDELLTNRKFKVIYSDDNPNLPVSETRLPTNADSEPANGMAGAGYIELKLTQLLSLESFIF